jgi:pimeloyl-ACP methyl ester carboxylesterase
MPGYERTMGVRRSGCDGERMSNALTVRSPRCRRSSSRWLDGALYPFATKRFATPHGSVSYVDEGAGPPVLFVHGTPSWSFEWRAVISALSREYRCIAPDHLGFGLSDKPPDAPLAPEDHAERLRALVLALDLTDLTLVVHDFGGPIGLPIALDLKHRVTRVIVVNSFMWSHAEDPAVARIDRFVRSFVGRVLYRFANFSPRVLLPASFADKTRLTRRVHRHYVAPFSRRSEREAPYALACALIGSSAYYDGLWARRSELARVPLTIVWGERDPAFGRQHLQRWIGAFPSAHVVRVPDAGHFVAEERPDVLITAIRARGEGAQLGAAIASR